MGYGKQNYAASWRTERILTWLFSLGFAREQLTGPEARKQDRALAACGSMLPWVLGPAVIIWAQIYDLSFLPMLMIMEIQAALVGVATMLFIPRPSPTLLLNTMVNVFLSLLALFFALVIGAFLVGLLLLFMAES